MTCIFGSSDVLSPNSNKSHVNEISWLSGILKHVSCFLDENPHLKYVSTRFKILRGQIVVLGPKNYKFVRWISGGYPPDERVVTRLSERA